jgi:hypothetical protein
MEIEVRPNRSLTHSALAETVVASRRAPKRRSVFTCGPLWLGFLIGGSTIATQRRLSRRVPLTLEGPRTGGSQRPGPNRGDLGLDVRGNT